MKYESEVKVGHAVHALAPRFITSVRVALSCSSTGAPVHVTKSSGRQGEWIINARWFHDIEHSVFENLKSPVPQSIIEVY